MKIIKINPNQPEPEKMEMAREVLRSGGTVVYPTDTLYGLGANIFIEESVKKVYQIKKRSGEKPLSICLSSVSDLGNVAQIDTKTVKLVEDILPGPFTLILEKKEEISTLLTAGSNKIGVRIPDSPVCRELSLEFPITTTSANISGKVSPATLDGVMTQLKDQVDMYLDGGDCAGVASTVMDLTSWPPEILRTGPAFDQVRPYLDLH